MTNTESRWPFLLLGVAFGIVLVKAEVVSWFRIQEMFRFDSFHMYGVIGSAVAVGWLGRTLLGRGRETESIEPRHAVGGTVFGLGWALTGACPGPMYALIGNGQWPYAVVLAGAIAGTWSYGLLRETRWASRSSAAEGLGLN